MRRRSNGSVCGIAVAAIVLAIAGAPASVCAQQQLNPVYVDDSPVASETFSRVKDHLGAGNVDEAVRVLQILLDEQGDRVIGLATDQDLFISVRESVHRLVLGDARLLDRYRQNIGPRAAAMLARGEVAALERQCLMTAEGFEAALRLAQSQLEAAQFEASLRTLLQLEDHPDRRGESGKAAAQLVAQVARYLPRNEVTGLAQKWARQAGAGKAVALEPPVRWPAAALIQGQSPMEVAPPLRTQGLVSKPLWSAEYAAAAAIEENLKDMGEPGLPRGAVELLVMPTVSGEMVFVNDGTTVSAWDQFTLAERWRINPAASDAAAARTSRRGQFGQPSYRGWALNPMDVASVSVKGRTAVAATGRAMGNSRDGDTRISAMDARTGRVKWSVELGELDPLLADAVVRGPLAIEEGVVIIGARKALAERRLLSLVLVGLDLETGTKLWARPLGSSGMLPYMSQPGGSESSFVAEGVVYRADRLGAIGAFEVANGRPLWVRRAPVDAMGVREGAVPWRIGGPIVDGDSVFALAPDQLAILRLDRRTGRLLSQKSTDRFGVIPPDYIIKVGRFLAGVGADQLGFLPIDDFEDGLIRPTARMLPPGIHGRVVAAGDRLIVPVPSGLAIYNPAAPDTEPQRIDLDLPGSVVPIESQLIIADDSRLHSYLLWEVAESMLMSRMQSGPDDPSPAVTFAELAYRAGRPDRILEAVDAALRAITARPDLEASASAARRLFDALREMTTNSVEPRDPQTESAATSRGGPKLEDPALIAALVDRMGRCAVTSDDRVTYLMALGRVEEQAGRGPAAAAAYQRVLDDSALGGSTWRGVQLSVRADLEAMRRIEQLVQRQGPGIYAEQEAAAATAFAAIDPAAPPERLAELAMRYPLSTIVPRAYLQMAQTYGAPEQEQLRLNALESGVRASVRVPGADTEVVGKLAGELVEALSARGQFASAASALRVAQEFFPNAQLRAGDRLLDGPQLAAELDARVAQNVRWPNLGPVTGEGVQLVGRTTLMEPLLPSDRPSAPSCFATFKDDEVALWSIAAAKDAELVGKAWSMQVAGFQPTLLRTDSEAAYFLLSSTAAGQVLRVASTPGGKTWATDQLRTLFDVKDPRGMRKTADGAGLSTFFPSPQDGILSTSDLTAAMDDRTIAIVQRGGKAAAFDTDTGATLWSGVTPVSRVYDVDVAGGVLIIAGDMEVPAAGGGVADLRPIVQTIDARTGRPLQRLSDVGGRTHWVRTSPDGATLLLSLDRAVVSFDLASGRANWVLSSPDLVPVSQAWVAGDRVVMVSPDRTLWQASLSTGRLRPQPLDAPRTHVESLRPLEAFTSGASEASDLLISTGQGLIVFGPQGELRGVDALGGFETMLPPRPAQGRAVTIETIAEGRTPAGLMIFQVHQMETATAMLVSSRSIELGAHPMSMMLLDGRIVISGGGMTIVLSAPAEPAPAAGE
mgnify:CR=1 FL=1